MAEVLNKTSATIHTIEPTTAPIGIKLDAPTMLSGPRLSICTFGQDKLGYIYGDLPQPPSTNPIFRRWRTDNAIIKGWLINSMDPSLISNFICFLTANMVWDAVQRPISMAATPPRYMILDVM